jgi:ABC-type dipeptide/oligopeptide/nickel transport system ATPase subunit
MTRTKVVIVDEVFSEVWVSFPIAGEGRVLDSLRSNLKKYNIIIIIIINKFLILAMLQCFCN